MSSYHDEFFDDNIPLGNIFYLILYSVSDDCILFRRSERDQLTALMRSRTVGEPVREEEKKTEMVPSEPFLPFREKEEYPKTPALENGIENHLVKTPDIFTSSV